MSAFDDICLWMKEKASEWASKIQAQIERNRTEIWSHWVTSETLFIRFFPICVCTFIMLELSNICMHVHAKKGFYETQTPTQHDKKLHWITNVWLCFYFLMILVHLNNEQLHLCVCVPLVLLKNWVYYLLTLHDCDFEHTVRRPTYSPEPKKKKAKIDGEGGAREKEVILTLCFYCALELNKLCREQVQSNLQNYNELSNNMIAVTIIVVAVVQKWLWTTSWANKLCSSLRTVDTVHEKKQRERGREIEMEKAWKKTPHSHLKCTHCVIS